MRKKKKNPERIQKYRKAFMKFAKCSESEFEIKEYYPNGPYLVNFNERVYEVDSYDDMREFVKEALTFPDSAMLYVPLYEWIDVAEDVHLQTEFIDKLIPQLEGKEYQDLCMALTISTHTSRFKDFWITIYETLDSLELYGKAIVVACQVYKLEEMCDELMSYLVSRGDVYFNQLKDGIFDKIYINIKGDDDDEVDYNPDDMDTFYFYTIDPSRWETN